MTRYKWCCDGNNATMVVPLWPETIEGIKWYTALYQCPKCGEYTKRGETNQRKTNTTFVKVISDVKAQSLIKEAIYRKEESNGSQKLDGQPCYSLS